MLERFRAFLERPLDPAAGQAIVVCAAAVFLGLGVLAVLGHLDGAERPAAESSSRQEPASAGPPSADVPAPAAVPVPPHRRQDPQDVPGSEAARRVAELLRERRALQQVPYRRGELAIDLVGARHGKAVLRVSAPDIATARRGWLELLRRHRDDGRAYLPVFEARGDRDG